MRINLITKTYNEARLVPYFFRHYDQFVTNYYIWDNLSTDNTKKLLLQNPKVTVFDCLDKELDDYNHRDFKNNAWKEFKDCDWIINIDFDEFLYHPTMDELLSYYIINGIQLVRTKGYQMFSETFPIGNKQIYELVNKGVRDPNYDKPIIFNPDIEPNYSFGAHVANPIIKVECSYPEIKLLHFKVLGIDFINNIIKRNDKLSQRNKDLGLGVWPVEKGNRFNPYEVYEDLKQNAIKVI